MKLMILILIIVTGSHAWAESSEHNSSQQGVQHNSNGAILKTPTGRQLIEDNPISFKWVVTNKSAKTVKLKIYRTSPDLKSKVAVGTYDFSTRIQSMTLEQVDLAEGQYTWEIHTFDEKKPSPLTSDYKSFYIESAQPLNLKADRIYGSFSTGRGEYTGQNFAYKLSFDTTPTIYEAGFAGGTEKAIYDVSFSYSDFTIRGNIEKFQDLKFKYGFRALGTTPYSFELFIGPQVRGLVAPIITSTNGVTVDRDNSTFINGGLALDLHSQVSERAAFVASFFIDDTVDSKDYFSNPSYEFSIGTLYSLRTPIGIGIDIGYKVNQATKEQAGGDVHLSNKYYYAKGKLIYSF